MTQKPIEYVLDLKKICDELVIAITAINLKKGLFYFATIALPAAFLRSIKSSFFLNFPKNRLILYLSQILFMMLISSYGVSYRICGMALLMLIGCCVGHVLLLSTLGILAYEFESHCESNRRQLGIKFSIKGYFSTHITLQISTQICTSEAENDTKEYEGGTFIIGSHSSESSTSFPQGSCTFSECTESCRSRSSGHSLGFIKEASVTTLLSHNNQAGTSLYMDENGMVSSNESNAFDTSSEHWDASESEDSDLYRPGGYHPTFCGEIFSGRYTAQEKIGWGEFSTVWLATDNTHHNHPVALKISKASAQYKESTEYEAQILTMIREIRQEHSKKFIGAQNVIKVYDFFEHQGPYGSHCVIVLEMLEQSLLSVMNTHEFNGVPIRTVKSITKQILQGLTFLHTKASLCHTDLKPENILITSKGLKNAVFSDPLCEVKITDFGSARIFDRFYPSMKIQTREYRAPEVIMGCESLICQAVDLWSLGCIVFELLTGDFLFDPKSQVENGKLQDLLHLNLIMQICGDIPASMRDQSRFLDCFFHKGTFLQEKLPKIDLTEMMISSYKMNPQEARSFYDFLCPLLNVDPQNRTSALSHLSHEWLSF